MCSAERGKGFLLQSLGLFWNSNRCKRFSTFGGIYFFCLKRINVTPHWLNGFQDWIASQFSTAVMVTCIKAILWFSGELLEIMRPSWVLSAQQNYHYPCDSAGLSKQLKIMACTWPSKIHDHLVASLHQLVQTRTESDIILHWFSPSDQGTTRVVEMDPYRFETGNCESVQWVISGTPNLHYPLCYLNLCTLRVTDRYGSTWTPGSPSTQCWEPVVYCSQPFDHRLNSRSEWSSSISLRTFVDGRKSMYCINSMATYVYFSLLLLFQCRGKRKSLDSSSQIVMKKSLQTVGSQIGQCSVKMSLQLLKLEEYEFFFKMPLMCPCLWKRVGGWG